MQKIYFLIKFKYLMNKILFVEFFMFFIPNIFHIYISVLFFTSKIKNSNKCIIL